MTIYENLTIKEKHFLLLDVIVFEVSENSLKHVLGPFQILIFRFVFKLKGVFAKN